MLDNLPKPGIFAHRGASAHAPENTIAAFEMAVEHGADALEMEVRLTADNHVIVIHDHTLDRTTDGTGSVRKKQLSEIAGLDAGSHFDSQYKGESIPLLEQVLTRFTGRIFINLELKNESSPFNHLPVRVIELVRSAGFQEQVLISSFNPITLYRCQRMAPEIPLGALSYPGLKGTPMRNWAGGLFNVKALHVETGDIDLPLVEHAHRRNLRLHVYTVNRVADIERMLDMNVDGIFTDDPLRSRRIIDNQYEKI